ncbi:hypothetical protein [Burkholderia sp. Ac-20353]|uniref:hypothetical protein n=1 Tax=Burkholderia sp. Ac-20353 TaxID=2703894 RepID=UPI00197CB046|nr:hypothetical protein [Burkholderia sp. Ac-20353]MBN3791623.1 hypothetical protein [Burkholderia sp. Ac-20353]
MFVIVPIIQYCGSTIGPKCMRFRILEVWGAAERRKMEYIGAKKVRQASPVDDLAMQRDQTTDIVERTHWPAPGPITLASAIRRCNLAQPRRMMLRECSSSRTLTDNGMPVATLHAERRQAAPHQLVFGHCTLFM